MKTLIILAVLCRLDLAATLPLGDGHDSIRIDMRPGDSTRAMITVRSNLKGTKVFIDSLPAGETPVESLAVALGKHVLHCIHPEGASWLRPAILETVFVTTAAPIERRIIFPTIYMIQSEPYGAAVRYRDSIVGTTPYILAARSTKGFITLSKDGFEEVTTPLPPEEGEMAVRLIPRVRSQQRESPLVVSGEESKNLVPLYVASGATVLSGVVAAYFKIRADGRYDDYRLSRDPATLDEIHRLDTFSGIALAATELSLITLSYFLLSR